MATIRDPLAKTLFERTPSQENPMSQDLMLDVGQANEMKLALRRAGWTNEDVKRFTEGNYLAGFLGVVRGTHEVREIEHIIDLSRDPQLPFPNTIVKGSSNGGPTRLIRNGNELILGDLRIIPTPAQNCGSGAVYGRSVFMILEDGRAVSPCVLDYMVEHPATWPQNLKDGRPALFWGHTFLDPETEREYVRMGYWKDGRVRSHYEPIRNGSNGHK
jgi:hypothetical protein